MFSRVEKRGLMDRLLDKFLKTSESRNTIVLQVLGKPEEGIEDYHSAACAKLRRMLPSFSGHSYQGRNKDRFLEVVRRASLMLS